MVDLYDVLTECADAALDEISEDGSLPAGTNGPWNDPETPVRNTGHWLQTFLKVYEVTGDDQYYAAGEQALAYLLSSTARPYEKTFHHRKDSEQDRCNGLIGQAWSIEALVAAASVFDRSKPIETAESIFLNHPFDERLAAWKIVDIDGSVVGFDMTFNHQLWFAGAGALLAEHPETSERVEDRVRRFLDELETNMTVHDSGAIKHLLKPEFDVPKYATVFVDGVRRGTAHKMVAGQLRSLFDRSESAESADEWYERAIGYHSFNLYGLGILHEWDPTHEFWESEKFDRALTFATSETFRTCLDGNPYGYPYNCSGIELAYALGEFDAATRSEQQEWLRRQFARTYDPETNALCRNTDDPTTLTARLYEATRLPNVRIPESAL
ncbi:hypothetical protein [Halobiforma nitratireducens]|uniref:Agl cluster protein AglQ n=1 Tax=Halobiforma nitratireducens JCM 10879 TaxID=1227454 RepID=M0LP63_9EURY|nr:hypothetical protein [Halobiforma nitratireducens]EMA35337.1 agl cluster protein AglQ [Halobiforma nitratireducens JCM 10879]